MHSRLLGELSAAMMPTNSSAAPAIMSTLPTITIPVFVLPVSIFVGLILFSLYNITKGMQVNCPAAATMAPQDSDTAARAPWPKNLEAGKPPDLTERELVCSAIELLDGSVPSAFRCAISLTVMRDPVVSSDGHSYEREQLRECISCCGPVSPITREAIAAGCVPNIALRASMEQWLTERTGVEITQPALQALVSTLSRGVPTVRISLTKADQSAPKCALKRVQSEGSRMAGPSSQVVLL